MPSLSDWQITPARQPKPGEYDIECRFHPRHVPAKLIVKEKTP